MAHTQRLFLLCVNFQRDTRSVSPAPTIHDRNRVYSLTGLQAHRSNPSPFRLRSCTVFLFTLVCFLQTGALAQSPRPREKMRADSLQQRAEELYRRYQMQPALQSAQSALEIYRALGEREGEAKALSRMGAIYMDLTDHPNAEAHLQKALQISREIGQSHLLIRVLNDLGTLRKAERKYGAAVQAFQEALGIAEASGDELRRAEQWMNLGAVYVNMDKPNEAIQYLNQALQFAQTIGNDSLQAATFLNLGAAQTNISDFRMAASYFNQGLALAQKNKYLRLEGALLSGLGNSCRNTGKYPEALQYLRKALEFNRATVNRWAEGNSLREMGIVYYYLGSPDSSLVLWNEAIGVFQDIPDWSMVGMVTNHLGVYYKNTGRPFDALKAYEKALALVREVKNEREEANVLANIGNVYNDILGDYDEAEINYKRALIIKEKLLEQAFVGKLLQMLGILQKNRGDYQASLACFHRALEIAEASEDRSATANLYGNIGGVYVDLDEEEKALPYLKKYREIIERLDEKYKIPEALVNLGITYNKIGEDTLALDYFHRAESLAVQLKQLSVVAAARHGIGEALRKRGRLDLARAAYERALRSEIEASYLRDQCQTWRALADLDVRMGNLESALRSYTDALGIAQRIGAPSQIWPAHLGLGTVLEKQGRSSLALEHYTAAVDAIESQRAKLTIESLKLSFLEEKLEAYHALIQLLLKSGRVEDAFNYLQRAKARSLLDVLVARGADATAGISPELLQRKKEREFQLRRVNELLSRAHAEQRPSPGKVAALQDSLHQIRFAYEELLHEIQLKHPRYAQLTGNTKPLTLGDIQQRVIPPGTVLLEYLITKQQTFGFVARPDTVMCFALDLSEAEIQVTMDTLLQDVRAAGAGTLRNLADLGFNLQAAARMYRKLVAPLEAGIPGGSALIIIPDGILHYLPFEALVIEIEEELPAASEPGWYERLFASKGGRNLPLFHEFERARFLVEKYTISYAPSASVLDPALLSAGEQAPSAERLAIFASPDFGNASKVQLKPFLDAAVSSLGLLIMMGPDNEWRFPPLVQTRRHVRELAQKVKPVRMFIDNEAREETFKQEADKHRYVHIATHAVTEERMPMYSRIVFTQDEDPAEDGLLHAHEILNLRLQADLVTLVGCQTGLGRLSRGEGLIGLARAFLHAGTPSLVVSLWAVEESSGLMMNHFYEYLERGWTKSAALRQAKLRMIRSHGRLADGRKVSYAHPFLWAPFVLLGSAK